MLIILVGPSGVGKTSVMHRMVKMGFIMLKSITTRARRGPDDDEYFFLTDDEFDRVELAEGPIEYSGRRYGLPMSEIRKTDDLTKNFVVIMEIHGALQVRPQVQCPCATIFIDAPDDHLVNRLKERNAGDTEKRIARFALDRKGISHCDYVVDNPNVSDVDDVEHLNDVAMTIISLAKGVINHDPSNRWGL